MKHLFIINPAAGKKGSTDALVHQIKVVLEARGLDYEIAFTDAAGDAERMTRQAVARGEDMRIYACGGDGTLNEVVNGAAGHSHVAITNVPKGTGNDFIKIFGTGWREGFLDLAALVDGPQTPLDLMDCNGKLGIGSMCAGVDARIATDVHKYKSLPLIPGIGAYILALMENVLFKSMSHPTSVEVMGEHFSGATTIICVMNGRYYGGGFMPTGEAMPDDGVLDMLLVPKVSHLSFFRLIGKYAKGLYKQCPNEIMDYHGDSLTFTATDGDGVAVVDGEVMRGVTFTIKLAEQKINFFYPAHLTYRLDGTPVNTPVGAL